MARAFPPSVPSTAPASERRVFEALSRLDDDWLVFHSVAWQGPRGQRQGDGEADFVVAHPTRGILVLEVKGGEISLRDGRWFSTNHRGEIFPVDPFGQLRHSKHVLGRYLAQHLPRVGAKVDMGHAVVFPDIDVAGALSPEAPREIIIDAADLAHPVRAVERVANHWRGITSFDPTQFKALRAALAPTVTIRTRLRNQLDAVGDRLIDLTRQQTQVLSFLRFHPRAVVLGGPGTGKTVLAVERARQLAADGRRVLLLCFNRPLGESLAAEVAGVEGITAGNFHSFAYDLAERTGVLPPGDTDQEFWDRLLPECLPDAAARAGIAFDDLAVDEGQDFHSDWWTPLQLLLADPDDGGLYVFADYRQSIYTDHPDFPVANPPVVLDVNCRNTNQIAARVAAVYGEGVHTLGVDGPPVEFVTETDTGAMVEQAVGACRRAMEEGGVPPERMAVLATRRALVDAVREMRLGSKGFTAVGEGGITAETVHRFKGLEADLVVFLTPELTTEMDRSLAYVGMSRARGALTVVGPPQVRRALG